MNTKEVICFSENKIIEIINEHYPELKFDSIVAAEELGNQIWSTTVSKEEDTFEFDDILIDKDYQWKTNVILDQLCNIGVLKEGDYEIDCTW